MSEGIVVKNAAMSILIEKRIPGNEQFAGAIMGACEASIEAAQGISMEQMKET